MQAEAGRRRVASVTRRSDAVAIIAVFALSRLVVFLIAGLVDTSIPLLAHGATYSSTPVVASLTGSDSVWYLRIASEGYHADPLKGAYRDWVFFPLYPAVTKAAAVLTLGDLSLAGVLVSNASFLAALFALRQLGERYLGPERSMTAVLYVAIAPGAVAFAMAYSDSLCMLLAICSCLAAERSRWTTAGILYALASVTRLPGVLLGVPLLLLWWQGPERTRLGALWLVLGPLAIAVFSAYLGLRFGDPLGFIHAQSAWNAPSASTNSGVLPGGVAAVGAILISVRLLYVFLLVYFRHDRMPLPYAALAVLMLAVTVGSLRVVSGARYLAIAWPFSWTLASRGPYWRMAWPALSASLFAISAFLHFTQVVAP